MLNSKLVGFAADGAANMMGNKTGLATQLKAQYPHCVIIHCLSHRLELAYKDAMKKNAAYNKLQTLTDGLFAYYKRSPKSRKALLSTFKVLCFCSS